MIERGNTISLLFVSDDYNHWLEERPTSSGVMAQVVNVDTYENKLGFIREGEICYSLLRSVLGTPVGVVNRISSSPKNMQLMEMLQKQMPMKQYFLMDSTENKLEFLSVSEDESDWEYEKLALEQGRPFAVVVDLDVMTAAVKQIRFKMVNGGPIFVD